MKPRSVLIMAAGTGGHIFPGLAVAHELIAQNIDVHWLGTPQGLENRLVPAAGLRLETIPIAGLRGRGVAGWLAAPYRIVRAMLATAAVLRRLRPGCVLSMGGYVAGPGGLAARILRIPLVIHEQNALAGLTNRWLRPLAARILTGFPDALAGGEFVGNPVRSEIQSLPSPEQRFATRKGALRILVIGGSQGARAFNEPIAEALARLPVDSRPHLRHQAGRQFDATQSAYRHAGVAGEVVEFIDDMADAWAWADLAICRAGALTVAELASAGVPAILVPFPAAVDDHQTANAEYLVQAGAAWLLPEPELTAQKLAEQLASLDRPGLLERAIKARQLARGGAAEQVAKACRELVQC